MGHKKMKMGHKIAAAGASAALAASGMLAMAAPAQAATSIEFCFVNPNGTPWSGLPVGVEAYGPNGWERVGLVSVGNAYGCAAFALYGDATARTVRGYAEYHQRDVYGRIAYTWSGVTTEATPGTGHIHVGTYYVACTPVTQYC